MVSTAELFTKAVHHHRYGNLAEAANMYRQVVAQDPNHADAWNFIGFLALQQGRVQESLQCLNRAISLDATKAVYHANLALANRALGNAPEASRCIQEAKRLGLNEPKGYNSLGIKFMNQGDPSAAAACFEQALEIKPDYADGFYNLGIALSALDRDELAMMAYQRALQIKPDFVEAYNNLGDLLIQQKRWDEAVIHLESALRYKPDHAKAHYNLGRAWQKKNDLEKAEACFREVLRIRPDHAKAHQQLGTILEDRGEITAANEHFTEASQIKPEASETHINAGISSLEHARLNEAARHFEEALRSHPNHVMALFYLGVAFQRLGRLEDAVEKYREAIRLQPQMANAYYQLGDALAQYGDCTESAVALEMALKLDPGHYRASGRLADCLERQGRYEEALRQFDQAIQMDDFDPGLKVRRAMALPVIAESREQISQSVRRLETELDALRGKLETVEDPYRYLGHRTFFLAWLGENQRPLLEKVAQLQLELAPELRYQSPHCDRPATTGQKLKVGFISKYFRHHTISKLNAGLIRHLDRDRFETIVFTFPHRSDEWTELIESGADQTIVLADMYQLARDQIAAQELDVLVYTDIGIDRLTYNLAHARLARVQCAMWGHPVTTGIPNVDYFISSRYLEVPQAEEHYTEKLERMDDLPMFYYRPRLREALKPREELDLPGVGTLYACPQNLFKLHPDFDAAVGGILRGDPRGRLVVLSGVSRNWDELLKARWQRNLPDVASRIDFVRRPEVEDFLHFLSHCDVILDPIPFGGGTTTFEALAIGTPVVTLPGPLMASRVTTGCYQQMGVRGLVAENLEQYVALAVRLGTDPAFRLEAQNQILAAADRLFDNDNAVRQLERFFLRALADRARL